MYGLRAVGLAVLMIGPMGATPTCYYPGEGEPPNSGDVGFCQPGAPEEGCACAVEGELGCTDDGFTHDEAFVCQDGVWSDVYDTSEADGLFCDHPDLEYNFCAFVEGEAWSNCTVAP